MNDTDVAARLAATFGHEPSEVHDSKGFTGRTCCGNCFTDWPCPVVRKIERVMVPVVREIADQRAAEAYDSAAAVCDEEDEPGLAWSFRARAADLRGEARR
jgi:hypothetical protein